jgi:hypothetical protein
MDLLADWRSVVAMLAAMNKLAAKVGVKRVL